MPTSSYYNSPCFAISEIFVFISFETKFSKSLLYGERRTVRYAASSGFYAAFPLHSCGFKVSASTICSSSQAAKDLLEEIVGEIRDEYDVDEKAEYEVIREGKEYRVSGSMNLEDFCDLTGVSYESEDSDTLGGFLLELLEHFPEVGECYETAEGVRFQILSMDKKRIETVLVTLPDEPKEQEKK